MKNIIELDAVDAVIRLPRDVTAADRDQIKNAIFLSWFNAGERAAQETIDKLRAELAELKSEREKLERAAAVTGEVATPGVVETQAAPDWREKYKAMQPPGDLKPLEGSKPSPASKTLQNTVSGPANPVVDAERRAKAAQDAYDIREMDS